MTVQKMIERIKWTMQNQSHNKEFCESCIQALEEVEQYRALGTVEELKEAREKQVAKKMPNSGEQIPFSYYCPTCKTELSDDGYKYDEKYCFECGQKIDWEEGVISD